MRKSSLFFIYIGFQVILLGCMFTHGYYKRQAEARQLAEKADLVRKLGLTDLCLFTEASYTRNCSLADFHSAFQDSPMSLEHFPSGSLVPACPAIEKLHANLD